MVADAPCNDSSLVCCTAQECAETAAKSITSNDDHSDNEDKPSTSKLVQSLVVLDESCPECIEGATPCNSDDCDEEAADNTTTGTTVAAADCEECAAQQPLCDVPGCDLLEWDEQAVDDLLRCCCAGAAENANHSHHSFATPYNRTSVPSSTDKAVESRRSAPIPLPDVAQDGIFPSSSSSAFGYEPPIGHQNHHPPFHHPHSHSHHQHTHLHAPIGTQSDISSSSYTFSSPALSTLSVPTTTSSASQFLGPSSSCTTSHIDYNHTPNKPTFACQWSNCHATFQTRESLIGHVNASHLLYVEPQTPSSSTPTSTSQAFSQPNLGSNGVSGLNSTTSFNGDTTGRSNNMVDGVSNSIRTSSNYALSTTTPTIGATQQAQDESFEHTLKCLWDSCSASLPILDDQDSFNINNTANDSQLSGQLSQSMPPSAINGHSLPIGDGQNAATLVRHLLQDHLHLPSDVINYLGNSLNGNIISDPSMSLASSTGSSFLPPSSTALPAIHQSNQNILHSLSNNNSTVNSPTTYTPTHPQSPVTYGPPSTSSIASALSAFHQHHHSHSILGHEHTLQQQQQQQQQGHTSASHMHHSRHASVDSVTSSGLSSKHHSRSNTLSGHEYIQPNNSISDNSNNGNIGWSGSEMHACHWTECSGLYPSTTALMEHVINQHIGSGKSIYYCHWKDCERNHTNKGFNQKQKIIRHIRDTCGRQTF